jgi:hypothetical protein
MAKKAQQGEAQPATAAVPLTNAIRAALADLGIHATKPKVKEWITRVYPTVSYKDSTFNSSLSSIRKKLKGDHDDVDGEPTVNDLLRVKEMADAIGGVDQVVSLLDKVDSFAKKVGGLGRLRQCLAGLKKLGK